MKVRKGSQLYLALCLLRRQAMTADEMRDGGVKNPATQIADARKRGAIIESEGISRQSRKVRYKLIKDVER